MEIHQLRYFLAIAQNSSIAEASKRLHVSQSAMSVALRDLEHELGFPLFDRNGRRLRINANGIYFAEHVQAAFATVSDAQISIANDISKRKSTVHCATNLTLGQVNVRLISEFRKIHPEIVLRFSFKGSDAFRKRSPDLEFKGTAKELQETEHCTKIAHEDFVAVFPEKRYGSATKPISLMELRDEPYILPGPGDMQDEVKAMFETAGFTPNVVGELQLQHEILNLVRAGVGFTIAPELTWLGDMNGLSARRIKDSHHGRNIYATIPDSASPSPSALCFFQFLQANAKKLLSQ